jgi:membrane-anchored protein YejM (alkaline phosphatase superfamily)
MEHGFWGHNSSFSEQQVSTPLVLWIPGEPPAVHDKLTSHMHIVATVMPCLGVTNPLRDTTIGIDLLSGQQHEYLSLSDWSRMGYVNQSAKITMPMNMKGIGSGKITGRRDEPRSEEMARQVFEREQPHLVQMMQEFGQIRHKLNRG